MVCLWMSIFKTPLLRSNFCLLQNQCRDIWPLFTVANKHNTVAVLKVIKFIANLSGYRMWSYFKSMTPQQFEISKRVSQSLIKLFHSSILTRTIKYKTIFQCGLLIIFIYDYIKTLKIIIVNKTYNKNKFAKLFSSTYRSSNILQTEYMYFTSSQTKLLENVGLDREAEN